MLTPLGHVLWTAVFGAAVFAAARGGRRYRLTFGVIAAYVGVAVLHGLWDSMGGISELLSVLVTGNAVPALEYGFARRGAAQEVAALSTVFYVGGLAVLSIVGIAVLVALIRRRRGPDAAVVDRHFESGARA